MIVNHESLTRFVSEVCQRAGTNGPEADQVAAALVEANLQGHDSHGVGMLPAYIRNIKVGHLKPNQHAELVSQEGAVLRVDGKFGYGQVVGPEAMRMGIDVANKDGVAVVALRNAHHLGRIGGHADVVVDAGMISIHYVNVVGHTPQVAPFGGMEHRLGTNPFCCGIPVPGGDPIILDMATSAIAAGKVRVARNTGNLVPEGCLIDEDGNETRDPAKSFAQLHFGKHKGYGLALICEILAGALVGNWSAHLGNPREGTIVNHMLTFIFRTSAVGEDAQFGPELSALIDYMKDTQPSPGSDGVMVPGDPERIAKATRSRDGIDIDDTTWGQLIATAGAVEMSESEIDDIISKE